MDKLKIGWGIRAMGYEERVLECEEKKFVKLLYVGRKKKDNDGMTSL